MSLATVLSRAQNGLAADLVTVEVHLAPGLPGLSIVGLPEAAVRESRDRVKAAIATCGYKFPNRRITVNLAPADLPKDVRYRIKREWQTILWNSNNYSGMESLWSSSKTMMLFTKAKSRLSSCFLQVDTLSAAESRLRQ